MLKWSRGNVGAVRNLYTATIGEGSLALHAFVASNGGGRFNYSLSRNGQDYMMEDPDRLEGSESTLRQAKARVELDAEALVRSMAWSLGIEVGP